MKKFIAFLLASIIALSMFASCDDGGKDNKPNSETESADTNNKENKPISSDDDKIDEESLRKRPENAASDFTYRSYWGDRGEGIEITEYVGTSNIVVVPKQIDGRTVIKINDFVFANKSTVKAVYIPETVKELGGAFGNNSNVELVICEGVVAIEGFTFGFCSSLKTVILGDSLEKLDGNVFSYCRNLTDLYISPSVESITTGMFFGCDNLTITGKSGSFIEQYANENGIKFQAK